MDDDEFGSDLDLDLEYPYHPYEWGVVGMGKTDNRLLLLNISFTPVVTKAKACLIPPPLPPRVQTRMISVNSPGLV